MKTLSPALAQLVSSPGHRDDVVTQPAQPGKNAFALETAQKAGALMQRMAQHKTPNAGPKTDDDSAMQAMLAMLLSQQKPQEMTALSCLPQTQNNVAFHLVGKMPRFTGVKQPTVSDHPAVALPAVAKAQQLPEALQKLFAQMTTSGDVTLTPEQQSQLAALRAQDPRLVVPAAQPHQPRHSESKRIEVAAIATPRRSMVKEHVDERRAVTPASAAPLNPAMAIHTDKNNPLEVEKPVPLDLQPEEWGEKLTGMLKDRIHFQINQQQQISTIRLDPPSLGKLEIAIQLDAGKLTVHIGASQPDVCRSLQQLSEQLRHQLTGQNFTQVEVNVSTDSGNGGRNQQQRHPQQDDEILTGRTVSPEVSVGQQRDSLLIKV